MTTSTTKPFDIAIIGGGIAGLTLAIGLLKHHVPVTIYESAHHFGEIGAGVAFGPNATRAMHLIDPSVKKGFDNCATTNQWDSCKDVWFDFRYGQDTPTESRAGKLFHRLTCPAGQATTHRAKFLDEMIKLLPAGIAHFGKRIVEMEEMDGKVHLKFKDGTEAFHTAVIGCDGIKSETRKYILGRDDPAANAVFTGKYCHRGLAPMSEAIEALGEELAVNGHVYLGKGGHILSFPIEKGKTWNAVAFSGCEKWDNPNWVVHSDQQDLYKDFNGWGEPVQKIIGMMKNTDVWALFDDPPARTYYKGRVAVMGDAAHAAGPHQGSGAGMAIEDAYVLSTLLGHVEHADEVERAFNAYDTIRRERTQKLVATTREASHLWELEHPDHGEDFESISRNINERMLWIWNEDLEAEVEKGLEVMQV